MKARQVLNDSPNEPDWKKIMLRPFLLGLAFGMGCYVAKVIINSPIMSNIVDVTATNLKKSR